MLLFRRVRSTITLLAGVVIQQTSRTLTLFPSWTICTGRGINIGDVSVVDMMQRETWPAARPMWIEHDEQQLVAINQTDTGPVPESSCR